MSAAIGISGHTRSTSKPAANEPSTAPPLPPRQNRPSNTAGVKHAAYIEPDSTVSPTIPPGGRIAMIAVMKAKRATQRRVRRSSSASLRWPRSTAKMSRSAVEAITRSTLSSEDIAAATMATTRNAVTPGVKMSPCVSNIGTIRSVSLTPSGKMLRAYSPSGTSSE